MGEETMKKNCEKCGKEYTTNLSEIHDCPKYSMSESLDARINFIVRAVAALLLLVFYLVITSR